MWQTFPSGRSLSIQAKLWRGIFSSFKKFRQFEISRISNLSQEKLLEAGAKLAYRTFRNTFAAIDNHYPLANIFGIGKQMACGKNRHPAISKRANERFHLFGGNGIKPGSRLV
jgi:hypothetical protein